MKSVLNFRYSFIVFSYGDQIKEDEVGWICSTHGDIRTTRKVLLGKPEAKRATWDT